MSSAYWLTGAYDTVEYAGRSQYEFQLSLAVRKKDGVGRRDGLGWEEENLVFIVFRSLDTISKVALSPIGQIHAKLD